MATSSIRLKPLQGDAALEAFLVFKDRVAQTVAESSGSASERAAKPDNSLAELISSLNSATKSPKEQIQDGKTPAPANMMVVPVGYDRESFRDAYANLVDMASLSQLYTGIYKIAAREKRGHPAPYDITVYAEANLDFKDMAQAAFDVMTGPLAGLYNITATTHQTFKQEISKKEIHLTFLTKIFKGLNLGTSALKMVDTVLETFGEALGNLSKESGSSSQSVFQAVRVNQIIPEDVSGGTDPTLIIYRPVTRLILLEIEAASWYWIVKSKHSSVENERFKFDMTYSIVEGELNLSLFGLQKPIIQDIMVKTTGKNLQEFGKQLMQKPVEGGTVE